MRMRFVGSWMGMLPLVGLSILFLPLAALGQVNIVITGISEDQLLPLNTPRTVTVECRNAQTGAIVSNCNMTVEVLDIHDSNFHYDGFHTGTRPKSTVSRSSGTGSFSFTHTTVQIVGLQECVFAESTNYGASNIVTYWVGVGRPDVSLFYNDHDEWEKIGATPKHGDVTRNRYMTWNAANRLYDASRAYLAQHGLPTGEFPNAHGHQTTGKLGVNDMSLPFGGKFDLNGKWGADPSETCGGIPGECHLSHHLGTAVDIRANTAIHAIPLDHQETFRDLCTAHQAVDARIEFPVGHTLRHIHCRWGF